MGSERLNLIQGTLEMLILKELSHEPQHGFAVGMRIHRLSRRVLRVEQGSLYPALRRLERKRLIASKPGVSENNRKAKFYRLTAKGQRQLELETRNWRKLVSAMNLVLTRE